MTQDYYAAYANASDALGKTLIQAASGKASAQEIAKDVDRLYDEAAKLRRHLERCVEERDHLIGVLACGLGIRHFIRESYQAWPRVWVGQGTPADSRVAGRKNGLRP